MVEIVAECGKNWFNKKDIIVKEALANAIILADKAAECGCDVIKWQAHVLEDEKRKRSPKRWEWIGENEKLTPFKEFWVPLKEHHDKIKKEMLVTPMSA